MSLKHITIDGGDDCIRTCPACLAEVKAQRVVSPPPTPDVERLTWQPIATAPTYRAVLVYVPDREHYGPAVYRAILGEFGWTSTGLACGRAMGEDSQPTHWMPLPDPPVAVAGDTPTPGGEQP